MAERVHSEGWITFASVLAGLAGVANCVFGLAAVMGAAGFPAGGILFTTLSTWGWLMLVFGALQILASFLLIGRYNSGRILAIVLASVSIVGWMTWLGALPFAGVAALALDILVIYGLSVTAEYFETSKAKQAAPTGPTPIASH